MINHKPIPCAHETKGVPTSTVLPDYHPLTRDEVVELLVLAEKAEVLVFSQIQCRLAQAIPGAECPHAIDGPVSKKSVKLDRIFVNARRRGNLTDPRTADMLFALMVKEDGTR